MQTESAVSQSSFAGPDILGNHGHARDEESLTVAGDDCSVHSSETAVHGYRSLVKERIDHLLDVGTARRSSAISRGVLPGLFRGFDVALGVAGRIEFDLAVNRLTSQRGPHGIINSAARRQLVSELMVNVLRCLAPYEAHAGWFLNMVNEGTGAGAQGGSPNVLSEEELALILRTLSVDLRCAMLNAAQRSLLESKYVETDIRAAERVLDALWRPVMETRRRLSPAFVEK